MTRTIRLRLGDSFEVIGGLTEAPIAAVVTDPPYGISFMSKDWDNPSLEVEEEDASPTDAEVHSFQAWAQGWLRLCFEKMVPGGTIKVFGATRTFHRMTAAMESVGFKDLHLEAWAYGSGFPKSLNVSRSISERKDLSSAQAAIEYMKKRRLYLGLSRREFEIRIFGRSDGNVRNWEEGISVPRQELWSKIQDAMGVDETPFDEAMDKGYTVSDEAAGSFGYQKNGIRWNKNRLLREANTEAAKKWDGWGTALKPAWEPFIVGRKP